MPHDDPLALPYILSVLDVVISLVASAHVLLSKRDTRAAIGWIGVIWLSPLVGTMLYGLLGINRVRRKAQSMDRAGRLALAYPSRVSPPGLSAGALGPGLGHLEGLQQLVGRLTREPIRPGNAIEPLRDGDQAYPAMLRAIEGATQTIELSTYIFNDDPVGVLFVEALGDAVRRGVAVRVLVDDLGRRYDLPTIIGPLRRAGIPYAKFHPTLVPLWMPYANLRNHRKILVVDGRLGFTGGMNIDADYLHRLRRSHPKHDLHFRIEGPVVSDLRRAFADDWTFCTGECLDEPPWPDLAPAGDVLARGIPDGPDEDLGKLHMTILGALASAKSSITVVTPYFLPDSSLVSALNVAAMRNIRVDIVLPSRNNLGLVQWASTALLWQVLERGCRVWNTPPPFDHTKLMIVDRAWTLLGSSNWDPRSLRLNFEFNVECYSTGLAATLDRVVQEKIAQATRVTLEDIEGRSLAVKLRDGIARLFSPYL